MSPSEPGLRGRGREKGRKSAALLQPRCFLGGQEGVKEPKAGWGGMVGKAGKGEGEILVLACVREKREREKLKQQF